MGLFPKEQEAIPTGGMIPLRMALTREKGTRTLILLLVTIAVVWYAVGFAMDKQLLSKHWFPLQPDMAGLTVVGTLNSRGNYDSNTFKIITENKSSKVALTEVGWNRAFDEHNSPLCSEKNASAIQAALDVDGQAGYAMLEPFVRASVAKEMNQPGAYKNLSREMPITVERTKEEGGAEQTTLGALLDKYSGQKADAGEKSDSDGGGSGSGKEVEHVKTMTADSVANTCPVVLTGAHFSSASYDEHPATVFTGKSFTVHLYMTPEGRSRFFQWSHDHVNEHVVLLLNHQVAMAGRITQPLDVSDWEISNIQDEESVKALVAYVNKIH